MGLDIAVGALALCKRENPEEAEFAREPFAHLNVALRLAGAAEHREPEDLPDEAIFSAQMWGYSGLHTVRRLAAHLALSKSLPAPAAPDQEASEDPLLAELFALIQESYTRKSRGFMGLGKPKPPPFMHVVAHSDAEGFYLPRRFDRVILDIAEPQTPGVGGMIGSSHRLYDECMVLAKALNLPTDLDPEAEEVCENADSPPAQGDAWQRYGIETLCITRLLKAAKLSVAHGAAVQFM